MTQQKKKWIVHQIIKIARYHLKWGPPVSHLFPFVWSAPLGLRGFEQRRPALPRNPPPTPRRPLLSSTTSTVPVVASSDAKLASTARSGRRPWRPAPRSRWALSLPLSARPRTVGRSTDWAMRVLFWGEGLVFGDSNKKNLIRWEWGYVGAPIFFLVSHCDGILTCWRCFLLHVYCFCLLCTIS